MMDYENMTHEEIAKEIRKALRFEFPYTAFRVSWDGKDLYLDTIGGELYSLTQFSDDIQDRIQNAVFSVAPILIRWEDTDWVS